MHDMPLRIVFCTSICVCLWTTRSISNHIKSTSQLITSYLNISWLFWSNCTCIVPVSTPKSRLLHNRTKCPSHSTQIDTFKKRPNKHLSNGKSSTPHTVWCIQDIHISIHRMDTERAKDSLIINRIICKIVAGSTHWNAECCSPPPRSKKPVSSETKKTSLRALAIGQVCLYCCRWNGLPVIINPNHQYHCCRYVPFALLLVAFPTLILSKVKDASAEVFT